MQSVVQVASDIRSKHSFRDACVPPLGSVLLQKESYEVTYWNIQMLFKGICKYTCSHFILSGFKECTETIQINMNELVYM